MNKITKIRLRNTTIFCLLYVLAIYLGYIAPNDRSGPQGSVRGVVIGIPLILLIITALTIVYTKRSGGNWQKVKQNLKHNILGIVSFTWKD